MKHDDKFYLNEWKAKGTRKAINTKIAPIRPFSVKDIIILFAGMIFGSAIMCVWAYMGGLI